MRVFELIPVHNKRQMALGCLEALERQTYEPLETVVVDDGSTDGTAAAVRERFPEVTVLHGDGSLWWTGAMRLGVDHILRRARPGDFVLSLNDDTTFDERYVATLVETSAANGRAIVGSFCLRHGAGVHIIEQGGRFDWRRGRHVVTSEILEKELDGLYPFRLTNDEIPLEDCLDSLGTLRDLDFLFGRGTLFPVEVFWKIGGYNARAFPHYGADVEFSSRARKAGFDLILSLRARITNFEQEDSTGLHHAPGRLLSFRRAFDVLASRRSAYQLHKGFRFLDLCCPGRFRLWNKVRYLARALRASFGRTFPVLPFVLAGEKAFAALRYLKYLCRPVPIPVEALTTAGLDVPRLVKDKILRRIAFRGRLYFKVTASAEALRGLPGGDRLIELRRASFRLWRKLRWIAWRPDGRAPREGAGRRA